MALEEFKEKLQGWMTNPDGDDFCPDCWPKFLNQFPKKDGLRAWIRKDSSSTASLAETKRLLDCWCVYCRGCNKEVFSPYASHEAPSRS